LSIFTVQLPLPVTVTRTVPPVLIVLLLRLSATMRLSPVVAAQPIGHAASIAMAVIAGTSRVIDRIMMERFR
jgi:hypothetical protein